MKSTTLWMMSQMAMGLPDRVEETEDIQSKSTWSYCNKWQTEMFPRYASNWTIWTRSVDQDKHRCRESLTKVAQYEKSLDEMDGGLKLVESIEKNAKHYIDILSQAVDKVMPKETRQIS